MRRGLTATLLFVLFLTTSPSSAIPILGLATHQSTLIREERGSEIQAHAGDGPVIDLNSLVTADGFISDTDSSCNTGRTYSVWQRVINEFSLTGSTYDADLPTACQWGIGVKPRSYYKLKYRTPGEEIRFDEPTDSLFRDTAHPKPSFVDSSFQPVLSAAYPQSPSARGSPTVSQNSYGNRQFNPYDAYITPDDAVDLAVNYEQSWLVRAFDAVVGFFRAYWIWMAGALFVAILFLERTLSSRQTATY